MCQINTCPNQSLLEDPKQQPSISSNGNGNDNGKDAASEALIVRDFSDKVAYAFQLETAQGPLCQEPMQGVAVFLEELAVHTDTEEQELDLGRLTGESIRLVRDGITQGFLDWSPRIMLAMYSCEIQATSKSFFFFFFFLTCCTNLHA